MPDKFSPEVRSRIMAAIKSKNTKVELELFRELRRLKVNFRTHYAMALGNPDIAIPSKKIAIFIHGDFWHGWQFPRWRHRLKKGFWVDKITRNRERDLRTTRALRRQGWTVARIWEHELKGNRPRVIRKLKRMAG